MSLARKPKTEKKNPENVKDEKQVLDFINKGGAPSSKNEQAGETDLKRVQLRLESELVKQIDDSRKDRTPKVSRHNWLLEAIFEKLERE